MEALGGVSLTAPQELNGPELRRLGCQNDEMPVYGHQQLMISAQCVKKDRGRLYRKAGNDTINRPAE